MKELPKYIEEQISRSGEDHFLEFKEKTSNIRQILIEVCAFSNSQGGQLFVGVKDSGKVVGVKDPDGELEYLKGKLEIGLKPMVYPKFNQFTLGMGRGLIQLEIPESPEKPIGVVTEGKKWPIAYKRSGEESIRMGPVERESLSFKKQGNRSGLKYGSLEHKILGSIDSEPKNLSQIQKITKVQRPVLIRKLALMYSRELLEVKLEGGKEFFWVKEV